jgi:hypothetical protein
MEQTMHKIVTSTINNNNNKIIIIVLCNGLKKRSLDIQIVDVA